MDIDIGLHLSVSFEERLAIVGLADIGEGYDSNGYQRLPEPMAFQPSHDAIILVIAGLTTILKIARSVGGFHRPAGGFRIPIPTIQIALA